MKETVGMIVLTKKERKAFMDLFGNMGTDDRAQYLIDQTSEKILYDLYSELYAMAEREK